MTGSIGAGKTTLAAALAARTGAMHLRVDADAWRAREQRRTDRAPLDESVYRRSSRIAFRTLPDVVVDTTALGPGQVLANVLLACERP